MLLALPPEFLKRADGKFAGGVERAFMSTTKSAAVALDYSGGGSTKGSIMVIDFDMNSRGASIQWLSQYPHEEELLFPPCTGLSCTDVSEHGAKRCLRVNAQVSTARLDTREVSAPDYVPGTTDALQWVTALLGCRKEEFVQRDEWDFSGKNLSADEHVQKLALLVGRAAAVAAPQARKLTMQNSQLTPSGAALLAVGVSRSRLISLEWTARRSNSAGVLN